MDTLDYQLHGISKGLKQGDFSVSDIGNLLPAAIMLHQLENMKPSACVYMNNWGCERLGTSVDEIQHLAEGYYEKYFVKEESLTILQGMSAYITSGDFDKQYNFFQRVKLHGHKDYSWFYTVCKLIKIKKTCEIENKVILLSSPVSGMDNVIMRVQKTLEQDSYIRLNYRKFSDLTKREKEIIKLLANGNSSNEIANQLFLSSHTISTHRKNIIRKINCTSFAELLRFAIAFDLV